MAFYSKAESKLVDMINDFDCEQGVLCWIKKDCLLSLTRLGDHA
jgi:hypothetical protein